MKVVRAIASDYPEAAKAARKFAGPDLAEVRLDTPTAYFDLLRDRWKRQETFVLLEHDIVLREGVIDDLAACRCWWGGYAYLVLGAAFSAAFGCTKFDGRLMRLYPNIWDDMIGRYDEIPGYAHDAKGPTFWRSLDSRFAWMLERVYGFGIICTHYPALVHLNPVWMDGRDPYEAAKASPDPPAHACINGHPCRCRLGHNEHPCPARSNMDGSGVIVHAQPRLVHSGQEAPVGLL